MEPLPQTPGLRAALPGARYARHRPEATLLYELVDQHYPAFLAALERNGHHLPTFVQQEFAAYLKCGRLEYGFLRVRCAQCHAERLVAFSGGTRADPTVVAAGIRDWQTQRLECLNDLYPTLIWRFRPDSWLSPWVAGSGAVSRAA